jgi:hypothetical protein
MRNVARSAKPCQLISKVTLWEELRTRGEGLLTVPD